MHYSRENQRSVWVLAFFLNFFEAYYLFRVMSASAVFCFRGNAEKKMLFYPKELRVSID